MSTLRWICICLGAVALFNVLERLTNFMVAPQLNTFLSLYRAVLYPFCERLIDYSKTPLATYNVHVPVMPFDLLIIYVLIAGAVAQYMFNQRAKIGSTPVVIALMPVALVWPAILLGNAVALCVSPKLGSPAILFGWDIELAKVISTCLAIFGANYYLLTWLAPVG
jgi:hypothetical protein